MWSVNHLRTVRQLRAAEQAAERGPGPSRLAWRLIRLRKSRWLRRAIAIGVPVLVAGAVVWQLAYNDALRGWIAAQRDAVVSSLTDRPEFAVRRVAVHGASPGVQAEIEAVVSLIPGVSSMKLDVAAIQAAVVELDPVARAEVMLDPAGTLAISVRERVPEALWRDADDALRLIDREGVALARAWDRADHPALPVVMGEGADKAVGEALALFHAAPDLHDRLRAFVRVGERRWNLVLDRSVTILLPAEGAVDALARVVALQMADEILDRDLTDVDLRLPGRPTVRLSPLGIEAYRQRILGAGEEGEDT